ncbi:hypothetical protein Tco_1355749 [Tanacetum coccineum]
MIKADEQLASRLQTEEQELFFIEEKSRLLVEMIAERKKFFATQRAAEQRSKPPTKAQMRNRMSTYLKNMDDKEKGSEKKGRGSRKKTVAKKRVSEKKSEENDVAVNVESLATKYPIVDWKTHILAEDKMYYEIIGADGSTKYYKIFTAMLDDFDRQDMLELYRLVKERFKTMIRKDIKVKKSKNEQKPTRNEETSTRERFEANIESRIKTVVEKSQESKEKDKV